jgi:hypothetical protein
MADRWLAWAIQSSTHMRHRPVVITALRLWIVSQLESHSDSDRLVLGWAERQERVSSQPIVGSHTLSKLGIVGGENSVFGGVDVPRDAEMLGVAAFLDEQVGDVEIRGCGGRGSLSLDAGHQKHELLL